MKRAIGIVILFLLLGTLFTICPKDRWGRNGDWGKTTQPWGRTTISADDWTPLDITGLVGWWSLAEADEVSADVQDDKSTNSNTGTLVNSPAYTADHNGAAVNALLFDGINEYVNCGAVSASTSSTLAFWMKKDNAARNEVPIGGNTNDYLVYIGITGDIYLQVNNQPFSFLAAEVKAIVATTNWVHVTFLRTSETTCKLYLNGEQKDTEKTNGLVSGNTVLNWIAARSNNSLHFDGTIEDVVLYNTAITEAEITKLATKRY